MTRKFRRTFAGSLVLAAALALPIQADPNSSMDRIYPLLPEAVASFGAANLDGWLYVYGGHRGERHQYNAEDVSGGFHRLNLAAQGEWERLPGSLPLQSAALVALDSALYRVGGMAAQNQRDETNDLRSTASVERFDVRRSTWAPFTPLPGPRSSHDAVILGDILYVGGGWQLHGGDIKATWHDTLLTLDLAQPGASWKPVPQPFKRRALALAALGSKLYCLGGMDTQNKTSLAVDVYDTVSGEWSRGPELPTGPMKGFGCSAVAQAGGVYVSGMQGALYRLSAAGDAWDPVGQLRHPRFFHRLIPAGATGLIAVAGEDSEAKRADLEYLSASAIAPAPDATGLTDTQARHTLIVHP